MQILHQNANKIKYWWLQQTHYKPLRIVHQHLKQHLSNEHLQELVNKLHSINATCKGDGAGLSGGILTDMFIFEFFLKHVPGYSENHIGESDLKICDIPLSQKKINGKSIIALNWSKNKNKNPHQDPFNCDVMIINIKTEQWWKKEPMQKHRVAKITFNDTIPSGIYFVNKQFCKHFVKLSSNNKTNTLIESRYLYLMLKRSIQTDLFIAFPPPNKQYSFAISNAFLE